MWQLFEDSNFISHIASMKANFFLEITEFCIKELSTMIEKVPKYDQLQDEEIFRQIESLDDPDLQRLFVESGSEHQEEEKQSQNDESILNKAKKSKAKMKPLFTTHKPKAPTTSYLLFMHQNKAEIAARYKLTNISEVTKVASQVWRKMSQFEKEKYYKRSQEEKKRYREEMLVYKEKYADEIKQEKRRRQSSYKNKWLEKKKKINMQKLTKKTLNENENENIQHYFDGENSNDYQLKDTLSKWPHRKQLKGQHEVILIDKSFSNENESDESKGLTQI